MASIGLHTTSLMKTTALFRDPARLSNLVAYRLFYHICDELEMPIDAVCTRHYLKGLLVS